VLSSDDHAPVAMEAPIRRWRRVGAKAAYGLLLRLDPSRFDGPVERQEMGSAPFHAILHSSREQPFHLCAQF
jgi:hypothetical protein